MGRLLGAHVVDGAAAAGRPVCSAGGQPGGRQPGRARQWQDLTRVRVQRQRCLMRISALEMAYNQAWAWAWRCPKATCPSACTTKQLTCRAACTSPHRSCFRPPPPECASALLCHAAAGTIACSRVGAAVQRTARAAGTFSSNKAPSWARRQPASHSKPQSICLDSPARARSWTASTQHPPPCHSSHPPDL